jgi:hypothetical protein
MSRITLITLPRDGEFVNWTTPKELAPKAVKYLPLGILSLASNIPDHHEITILDAASYDWTVDEVIEKIKDTEPDILGISAVTRRVWSLREILRECSHTPQVWVGGPYVTFHAYDVLQWGADAVFVGSLADNEFAESVRLFEQGVTTEGVINCKTDVNDLEYPDRELLDLEEYYYKGKVLFEAKNRLPMFSSKGCPNRCKFCVSGDTMISTPDGERAIADIVEGDTVVGYNEDAGEVASTVVDAVHQRVGERYLIEIEDGTSIEISGEHPVFTRRGWVNVEDLTFDDEVLLVR